MSRPGVGLVEDRDVGFEDRHLQDLVALLLAAREALVEVAVGERSGPCRGAASTPSSRAAPRARQVDALAGRQRLAQELADRHAGDLLGVLEGQEHAGLRARTSTVQSVMSSPLQPERPPVTDVLGDPISVLASVVLPDPLGPMIAWTSPGRIVSDTPRRIGASRFSAGAACRSSIRRRGATAMS
jgi:hypothetical protein